MVAFLNLKFFEISSIIYIESERKKKRKEVVMTYREPQNFTELVEAIQSMKYGEWVKNDKNDRYVIAGDMCGGKYELYESKDFLGCKSDAEIVALFIANDWEFNNEKKGK